jgi:hypothetical protein
VVDHALLLKDLQKQVRLLETDLRERSEDPTAIKGIGPAGDPETFDAFLKREYERARDAERTATTEGAWREGQVTQAAVAWVLATVFVRFCEDNGLLEQPFIAGPKDEADRYSIAQELKDAWVLQGRSENPDAPERTDRDWLEHAFEQMSVSSVMAGLFDKKHNPMWTITPSHQAAKTLIDFWRSVGDDGQLVHDFADPEWNTRFLGDLYQDLSEAARKIYALLQTPEFVEEFILDYTLEPAVEEFGLDGNRIYQDESKGFRMIDPTCGSGHFLLGAFHRLLNKWREAEPGASKHDLINRSLRSVHGVDKNPFAVAIARFRLLVAAMKEGGVTRLKSSNPYWPIFVATGDSLLHGRGTPQRQGDLFADSDVHCYSTEDVGDYGNEIDILGVASYHVVVGNPPYITVKDKQENQNYRARYDTCSGTYALSVPFAERFFNLAKRAGGDKVGPGFVGQLTASSFMKREFGKKLIEDFFRNEISLTHVIDTSGAYIPGHGTPTVILIGRNLVPSHTGKIRAALGIRGEPEQPKKPEEGHVWGAIVNQMQHEGESESEWVSSGELPWGIFKTHPWSMSGGGALGLVDELEKGREKVSSRVDEIGLVLITGEESAFIQNPTRAIFERGVRIHPSVEGVDVRDWGISSRSWIVGAYDENSWELLGIDEAKRTLVSMWPLKKILFDRKRFSVSLRDRGAQWYEWREFYSSRLSSGGVIAFPLVATQNNFVYCKDSVLLRHSSSVIKLPENAAEDQYLDLLGIFNSSLACFWLKQVCQPKGGSGVGCGIKDEKWEERYEFTGTKLQEFPLPKNVSPSCSEELHSLAGRLSSLDASVVVGEKIPTAARLRAAQVNSSAVRQRMISLQEELDWDVYRRYGLIGDSQINGLVIRSATELPPLALGERAFEIVLARKMKAGGVSTEWFNRHGSTPITEIPKHWPETYKKVVAKRIELIESDKNIGLIERPEYKRRWQSEPWEKKQQAALKSWLLDKCEDRRLWFSTDDYGDERARPLSVRALANRVRDLFPEVAEVAALYDSSKDFAQVIADIVTTEHVPFLAALRYKDTGMRKRADWEHVWDLQRQEDALNADLAEGEKERRLDIPVPPKYTSADFRKNEYWMNRGKLDVPKERFISYLGAESDTDPTLLLGWAGWDHAQQADALATLAHERLEQDGWSEQRDRMVPLLAGLAEILPWVRQWHSEKDEYGDTPADHAQEDLTTLRDSTGITESEMKAWRPATRGHKKA